MNPLKHTGTNNRFLNRSQSEAISEITCRVRSLRDLEEIEIRVQRESSGQWLLDEVCDRFGGIQEKDYFGLRFVDKDKQKQWIDLGRSVYRQLKESTKSICLIRKSTSLKGSQNGLIINTHPYVVSFRLKHFPASPLGDLGEETACYFLYLQLRRDLYSGRLLGRSVDLYQLAAYAVQDELGDYEADITEDLSRMKLLPNLNTKTEPKIIDLHKNLSGLTPPEARQKFLEKACQLDTYGVEPFYVKDQKGNNLYVGLTHDGVSTFQGSKRAHLFAWEDIYKILFKGKMFIIHVYLDEILNNQSAKKKHVLGFKCESTFAAEALWKWANDRLCFFSLNRSSEAKRVKSGGGLLKKRRTFKFAGRCQREILNLSRSMNCLDVTSFDGNGMIAGKNTLVRDQTVTEYDIKNDERTKFLTMPNRDTDLSSEVITCEEIVSMLSLLPNVKTQIHFLHLLNELGRMLGTQDTLDSLFMGGGLSPIPGHTGINMHGDQASLSSHDESPGLIVTGKSSSGVVTSNNPLDNIVEEPIIYPAVTEPAFTLPNDAGDAVDYVEGSNEIKDPDSLLCAEEQKTLNELQSMINQTSQSNNNESSGLFIESKPKKPTSTFNSAIIIFFVSVSLTIFVLSLAILILALTHHKDDPTFRLDHDNYMKSTYRLAQQLMRTSNQILSTAIHQSIDSISTSMKEKN